MTNVTIGGSAPAMQGPGATRTVLKVSLPAPPSKVSCIGTQLPLSAYAATFIVSSPPPPCTASRKDPGDSPGMHGPGWTRTPLKVSLPAPRFTCTSVERPGITSSLKLTASSPAPPLITKLTCGQSLPTMQGPGGTRTVLKLSLPAPPFNVASREKQPGGTS